MPDTLTEKFPVDPKELADAVTKSVEQRIKIYPRNSLWVSQLGHPCQRQQEYAITRWQDQIKISADKQQIFDEGNIHEPAIMEKLQKAGFKTRQSQRPLFEKVKVEGKELRYGISGRLDFEITHDELLNGEWYPVEAKSMSPFVWDTINDARDLLDAKQHYVRSYLGQVNLYLYAMGKEQALMVLKNKLNGRLKFVWIRLDLELVEKLLKRAESINERVAMMQEDSQRAEEYMSSRIEYNAQICGDCPFHHICLPDASFGGESIEVDPQTIEALERREILVLYEKEFKNIDEELKEKFKSKGVGKYLVGEKFDVVVAQRERTVYNVPDEIKKPYAEKNPYLQVTIKAIDKERKK